jgi:glycosyltransferase involved in cell wall biosynthesis
VSLQKIIPVGAGINLPFDPSKFDYLRDYSRPNLLFIGRDFSRKGGYFLLRAFELVKKEIPGARLTIIGPEMKYIADGISLLGPLSKTNPSGLEKLIQSYSEASVFVMPSLYEPFGIVFCEAMSFGLPCIGTSLYAMPEIIKHGETGFIVPPSDEFKLATAIITMLKDPVMCQSMGFEGRKRYQRNYSWDAVAQKMIHAITAKS